VVGGHPSQHVQQMEDGGPQPIGPGSEREDGGSQPIESGSNTMLEMGFGLTQPKN
jgi:hypothetical protein